MRRALPIVSAAAAVPAAPAAPTAALALAALVIAALVFAISLLAACSGGSAAADKVVNVYNWSDYIDPAAITAFEKQTGVRVNYDVFDSNEVLETKLLTGHTGYDVVVPSGPFLERQIRAGVYRKLDKSRLPNLKNIDPEVASATALYDPGNQYGVDYMWITSGPGYNTAMIHKRMPDAPTDSWRIFFDPAVISRFQDCGVAIIDAPTEVVATVLLYLGRDPNSEAPADLDAAARVLMAMRRYVRYVHSSRYIDDLANGEICLALGWSGDVKQARNRAREAGKGIDIAYSIPKEGAIRNFDMLAIPADAPHPGNAYLFIDYLLRPDVAARNSNLIKYANGDSASLPLLDPDVRDDPGIYPPPAVRARLVPERAKSPQFTRLLNRMWTRFKTGQ
ncbi:MAG TPA: polyamine ABC transporter substrate-binding protein [Steroidobacteraceae bacterium]|nr:polyamine ABC transporter substrate-binding protein [Steroidobacteraceae bacterium]